LRAHTKAPQLGLGFVFLPPQNTTQHNHPSSFLDQQQVCLINSISLLRSRTIVDHGPQLHVSSIIPQVICIFSSTYHTTTRPPVSTSPSPPSLIISRSSSSLFLRYLFLHLHAFAQTLLAIDATSCVNTKDSVCKLPLMW
jgi:hypothetical protein